MSRPGIAAALSALIPGLGQARLGDRRRGFLIALPFVTLVVVAVAGLVVDPRNALGTILSPGMLVAILVILVALATFHVVAILDAYRLGNRMGADLDPPIVGRRALGSPLLIVAIAGVVVFYGTIEFLGVRAYQVTQAVFVNPSTGFQIPGSSFSARLSPAPGDTGPMTAPPPPTATPVPVPAWATDGRLNLLLIGSDAGPGRWLQRTDTMIVLSVDIDTGRAALFGIPRNMINVPLPPESAGAFRNGRYPFLLNSLYVYATQHEKLFPGGDARGFRAVTGAIQELVGESLDGAIVVNLNGFVDLVNAVGGLWLDVPSTLYDAKYPLPNGTGYIAITIPSGCHKLTGERALEYARSRHMDSDYGRMKRQQLVLVALARELDPLALLPRVPDLLDIAQQNLFTTIPLSEIANMAVLAAHVDPGDIQTIQFSPPTYPEFLTAKGIKRIRDRVATVFDAPAASPSAAPSSPSPSPKPCPKAS